MDLHGLDLNTAWKEYRNATQSCHDKKIKNLKVITGQGEMQKEFLGWVQADPFANSAKNIDDNKGAWTVSITKHKTKKESQKTDTGSVDLEILFTKFGKIGQ